MPLLPIRQRQRHRAPAADFRFADLAILPISLQRYCRCCRHFRQPPAVLPPASYADDKGRRRYCRMPPAPPPPLSFATLFSRDRPRFGRLAVESPTP